MFLQTGSAWPCRQHASSGVHASMHSCESCARPRHSPAASALAARASVRPTRRSPRCGGAAVVGRRSVCRIFPGLSGPEPWTAVLDCRQCGAGLDGLGVCRAANGGKSFRPRRGAHRRGLAAPADVGGGAVRGRRRRPYIFQVRGRDDARARRALALLSLPPHAVEPPHLVRLALSFLDVKHAQRRGRLEKTGGGDVHLVSAPLEHEAAAGGVIDSNGRHQKVLQRRQCRGEDGAGLDQYGDTDGKDARAGQFVRYLARGKGVQLTKRRAL